MWKGNRYPMRIEEVLFVYCVQKRNIFFFKKAFI